VYKVAFITAKKRDPKYLFQTSGVDLSSLALEAYLSARGKNIETLVSEEVSDIIRYRPDLVAITATSENYPLAIRIAKSVKENTGARAVIGGAHISSLPSSIDPVFDAGVIGEGEETLLELVNFFSGNQKLDASIMSSIRGIVYRDKDDVFVTPPRSAISDLGLLPLPNRKKWVSKIGMAYLMTARGCNFRCTFCAACRFWGGGVRFFPVGHVISEIKDIAENFKPKAIRIFDDIFTLNKERVREIISRLKSEGLSHSISYICWSRADLIDEDYVKLLKEGNFVYVAFGVESASERIMKELKGEGMSLKKVERAIALLKGAGINVGLTFILGTPGEKDEDMQATYDFIARHKDEILDIELNPLIAFPGTPIWDEAKKGGLVSDDMDWERLSDTGVITTFDFNNYIYLNPAMPFDRFMAWIERFKLLYMEVMTKREVFEFRSKTFPSYIFPSRLKRLP